MPHTFAGWGRMLAVGISMTRTSLRVLKTLGAASEVVAARTTIITAAVRSPLTGDHRELRRMAPEKVDAFSRAGGAAIAALQEAQSMWIEQLHHLAGMSVRHHPFTPAELA